MSGKIFGYLLCPPDAEGIGAQKLALHAFGVPEDGLCLDCVGDHAEGGERPAFQKLLAKLRPGDTLAVSTLGHLGRNYGEILRQWQRITEEKGASLVVLDMPHLDTRKSCSLDGSQLAGLVLQLLTRIAKVEYDFFRQRQAKGIAQAKARGVKFGRKPLKRTDSYRMFYEAWKRGDISARGAARFLGVDHHTFLKWVHAQEGPAPPAPPRQGAPCPLGTPKIANEGYAIPSGGADGTPRAKGEDISASL